MTARFVLAVCGGRDYADRDRVLATLDRVHAKRPVTLLVQGDCPTGADAFTRDWARARHLPCLGFPAAWETEGRAAGPLRNARMVAYGLDGLVAFPGGRGTADMTRRCHAAGVTVMVIPA